MLGRWWCRSQCTFGGGLCKLQRVIALIICLQQDPEHSIHVLITWKLIGLKVYMRDGANFVIPREQPICP
ncbi:MAG: hypothetical protein BGN99_28190 [Alphaproteobacteria bacterium 65-37]|nr:MAG: hypothetical protein BGN99_28190 [Alphaproteobacteria bacterium 65-37]